MALFECLGTTTFQVGVDLQLKLRVSMALENLDAIA